MASPNQLDGRWRSAWPDAVAFVTVLALAWWLRASATDLVWSLWLSSLVVGYAIILWAIFRPALTVAVLAWRDRALVEQAIESDPRTTLLVAGIGLLVGVFLVAFFTVHFVGFHYVHAQFLSGFFPMNGAPDGFHGPSPRGWDLFGEALRRYWVFLPTAFLAERAAFVSRPAPAGPVDVSVTPQAIAARKAIAGLMPGSVMMLPYQKVVRMHLLIFFFAFAHFAGLDNFAVYAVVYGVYFFPWRLLGRRGGAVRTTTA
jgi:hypothetical protein